MNPEPHDEPRPLDHLATRLAAGLDQLAGLACSASALDRQHQQAIEQAERILAQGHQEAIRRSEQEQAARFAQCEQADERVRIWHQRWQTCLDTTAERLRRTMRSTGSQPAVIAPPATSLAGDYLQRWVTFKNTARQLHQRLEELGRDLAELGQGSGWSAAGRPEAIASPVDEAEADLTRLEQRLPALEQAVAALQRQVGWAWFDWVWQVIVQVLLAGGVLGLAAYWYLNRVDPVKILLGIIPWAACAIPLLVVFVKRLTGRRLAHERCLCEQATLLAELDRCQEAGRRQLDPDAQITRRVTRLLAVEAANVREREDARVRHAAALEHLGQRHKQLRRRLGQKRDRELWAVQEVRSQIQQHLAGLCQQDQARGQEEHAATVQRLDEELVQRRQTLLATWSGQLAELSALAVGTVAAVRSWHPPWSDPSFAAWQPATACPGVIPLGQVAHDPAAVAVGRPLLPQEPHPLAVPLALSFPGNGSLRIDTYDEAGRTAACHLLRNVVARILVSFPPGRARLILVDPVGLGGTFADFLALGDQDGGLLGDGVATDALTIDDRLARLSGEIERVVQKCLRHRYADLDAFNREAGEMAEPYRFLVIADYPRHFGETARERLARLLVHGPRCGVHLLVHHDGRPAVSQIGDWQHAVVVAQNEAGLQVLRPDFTVWRFTPEPPPAPGLLQRLVTQVGAEARARLRVEVPFSAVAPRPEEVWTLSSAESWRVPIGRLGADRLQYLELGHGTAQHVLIGGRTGSGKSTLFHAMIVSTALWYDPDQIEFYLIDFKKGVEFKPFATHRLPQARVIAIESDREFGLSVLRRLDQELDRRGELFRRIGVVDLPAFRRTGPILPRTLLLIDEFHEFFREDDAIARDAALLLDRFVRQGRAFGIHVVLGSQTLGGFFMLAKSTVGQMGVRIAMQCAEADSQLILHEDNLAARSLTRPGEAIYNDRSGLVAGNSPFQVVWLSEDEENASLIGLAAQAAARRVTPVPPVIFEGNLPARRDDNAIWKALLQAPPGPPAVPGRVFLGEPCAIKGPVELVLPRTSAGNLLVVGQHREAALGLAATTLLSLASAHPPGRIRLLVLNGEAQDLAILDRFARWSRLLPQGLEQPSGRELPAVLASLAAEVARRHETGEGLDPIHLIVFALHRLRALRPDEDGLLGLGGDSPGPGADWARILQQGPEVEVHATVWCDSLNSLNRCLGRRLLREFEARILFQMSAADSSELIDDTQAHQLGLHQALLIMDSTGAREKFRPYPVTDSGEEAVLGGLLARKWGTGG